MGNNYGIVGEIQETHRDSGAVNFVWILKGNALPRPKTGFCFSSPVTHFQDQPWYLSISPNGEGDSEEYIGVFLWGQCASKPVRYTVCIRYPDCKEEGSAKDQRYPDAEVRCVLIRCLPRFELLKNDPDSLTFKCELWIDTAIANKGSQLFSRLTQTEPVGLMQPGVPSPNKSQESKGVATLQKHFKDLLLRSENQDVTLKVKGKVFKSHKVILGARSPVFVAMLAPKDEKSKSNHLSIEDCDSDAFGEFLQYLYTGKLESLTPNMAMGIYSAAEKFELMELKEQCVEYLRNSMTPVSISDVIKFATNRGEDELFKNAVTFFTDNMEEVLETKEWQHFFTNNPAQANELYLKTLKTNYRKIK